MNWQKQNRNWNFFFIICLTKLRHGQMDLEILVKEILMNITLSKIQQLRFEVFAKALGNKLELNVTAFVCQWMTA
jgi:hypothetical protein